MSSSFISLCTNLPKAGLFTNIFTLISSIQIYFVYLKNCSTSLYSHNFCIIILYNIFHFPFFNNIYFKQYFSKYHLAQTWIIHKYIYTN